MRSGGALISVVEAATVSDCDATIDALDDLPRTHDRLDLVVAALVLGRDEAAARQLRLAGDDALDDLARAARQRRGRPVVAVVDPGRISRVSRKGRT